MFFLRHIVKKCWEQECKKRAIRSEFSRFWESKSWFLVIWEGPGWPWGPFWGFLGLLLVFLPKSLEKGIRGPPPKASRDPLFQGRDFDVFLECYFFLTLVILSAQRLHFGIHFNTFLGDLGLFKNSWKCVAIINFRGLTPSGPGLLAGLDRECVLIQLFCWRLRIFVVWGSQFWALLEAFLLRKKVLKNRAASFSE